MSMAVQHVREGGGLDLAAVADGDLVLISGLHPDEPTFTFRAQDAIALDMVKGYRDRVVAVGTFSPERMANLNADIEAIEAWQREHPDLVKLPD